MRLVEFNSFDGERVADSLETHRELWRAAVMDDDQHGLIKLRDLADGQWNVDTLYLLSVEGREMELWSLAETWGADGLQWIGGDDAGELLGQWGSGLNSAFQILAAWWD